MSIPTLYCCFSSLQKQSAIFHFPVWILYVGYMVRFQVKLRKYFSMNLKIFQALANVIFLKFKIKLALGKQKSKNNFKIHTH